MSKTRMLSYSLIVTIVACAGIGLWQQNTIIAWYRTWKLQSANPEMLSIYVRHFEALGLTGTDSLITCFQSSNETACQNARAVLVKILSIWSPNDSRRSAVLVQLADKAPGYSAIGQRVCLGMLQELMQGDIAGNEIERTLSAVLARSHANSEDRLSLYQTITAVLQNEETIEESLQKQAKSLVIVGIKSNQDAIRLAAIRLAVLPGLQLQEHLVPLLLPSSSDPSAEVRQLALLALGEHEKLISTDDLCQYLNDADKEVRTTTERILMVRGLSQKQIKLARMMNDQNPMNRAELPELVLGTPEVDSFLWMERLTRDPSPAVRAATARAIGSSSEQRLSSLLKEMVEQDKDQTVQQIARFYTKP